MDEPLLQAYARLTVHEIVMVEMMVEILLRIPDDDERNANIDSLRDSMSSITAPRNAMTLPGETAQVLMDANELGNAFMDKVVRRINARLSGE